MFWEFCYDGIRGRVCKWFMLEFYVYSLCVFIIEDVEFYLCGKVVMVFSDNGVVCGNVVY